MNGSRDGRSGSALPYARIHLLGASGSGTTTLGRALAERFGMPHFDTDDFFWLPTDPPFTKPRPMPERVDLLEKTLRSESRWTLSGSLCGWGDVLIPLFDLVVFLALPKHVRMERLAERERRRYGALIEPGGSMASDSAAFLEWASRYDEGGPDMRSRMRHDEWLASLPCPVLRIEGEIELDEKISMILSSASAPN